jgi:sarcosine oxidase
VGAGIVGLATARALARSGRRVLVLEQFEMGHSRGSSHGASRIFRLSYADEEYVRLARESLDGWRALEREAGDELLVTTGSLDCGRYAVAHRDAMAACGIASEELDEAEAERRFGVLLPGGGLLQADGGNLRADRCATAYLAAAVAAGAELREQTPVTAIEPIGDGVRLEMPNGAVEARAAVVAAGAWAPRLLATAGIELDVVPTRETVVYLRLGRSVPPPSLIHEVSPGRLPYALEAPGIGLKAGVHQTGPVVDPDVDGEPVSTLADEAAAWAAARFPDADPVPLAVETCLYTNAPGDRFLLERHDSIVVGSACSGHGFKFAPANGERLAALALEAAG